MITLAAISKSVVLTPVLMAVKEVATIQEGVQWANEQAWRWLRSIHLQHNEFHLDNCPNGEQPKDDGSDVPVEFFVALGDELFLTAFDGEEIFVIGVDEATIEDNRHKEDLPDHGDWAIPG